MNDINRLRDILPFAIALCLLASTAQLQATQHTHQYVSSSITIEKVLTGLILILIDQNPCAHWRSPMDMMRQGWSMSLFQASQAWSRMSA